MSDPIDPPPGTAMTMVESLRDYIRLQIGMRWDELRCAVGDERAEPVHILMVNRTWASAESPADVARLPHMRTPGPLYADGVVTVGRASMEFCQAVKALLYDGTLQLISGGAFRCAAIVLLTDKPPLLKGLQAQITVNELASHVVWANHND
jgi:hypothetical protein